MDGEEHLDDVVCEIVGLIEEAMTEPCTDENTKEAIDEEWVEQLVLDFLVFIEPAYDKVGTDEPDEPAKGIPT